MTHQGSTKALLLTLGLGAFTLGLTGCGSERLVGATAVDPRQISGAIDEVSPTLLGNPTADMTLARSVAIDGAVGGVIAVGRIRVTFPAGAFSGVRTITVVDASAAFVDCHLYPEGLTFSVPVSLELDLAGTAADALDATVFWYDPETATWVDIDGDYVEGGHTVVTRLAHFSSYRGNRAGW